MRHLHPHPDSGRHQVVVVQLVLDPPGGNLDRSFGRFSRIEWSGLGFACVGPWAWFDLFWVLYNLCRVDKLTGL